MQMFLASILLDDKRSVVDLLNAPYTFVNERLALPLWNRRRPSAIAFVRVDAHGSGSATGCSARAALLMATSYLDRTSPVLRGAWIMEHLLGRAAHSAAAGPQHESYATGRRSNSRNLSASGPRCTARTIRATTVTA